MNDAQYKEFLRLLMCSDPWPVDDNGVGEQMLKAFADEQAKARGCEGRTGALF